MLAGTLVVDRRAALMISDISFQLGLKNEKLARLFLSRAGAVWFALDPFFSLASIADDASSASRCFNCRYPRVLELKNAEDSS